VRIHFSLMVVAFVGGGSLAMAQGVSVGVKGGVSFATLSDDSSQDVDLDRRTGIVAGGFVTWPAGGLFSVQLEGLYTQKGAAFDQSGVTGTTKLDYFEVPLLFVVSTAPPRSGGPSLQVFGGQYIAFKVSAKGTGSFQGETVDVDIPDEEIDKVDLGVIVGAGAAFGRLSIEGRYTIGLKNINNDANDPTKVRNRSLAILAGVRF
jgi:Outer membrane protein beta-barrel domain